MKTEFGGLLIGCLMMAACQTVHADPTNTDFATVTQDALNWAPVPDGLGAMFAVVRGDPSKEGTYVIRVRFPAGVMDLPHSHSADRHVTVIEGTWYAGIGPDFDPAQAEPLPAGSYMYHPAEGVHWDGAAGQDDAVVQIIGNGPVATTQNHAERTNWVRVD